MSEMSEMTTLISLHTHRLVQQLQNKLGDAWKINDFQCKQFLFSQSITVLDENKDGGGGVNIFSICKDVFEEDASDIQLMFTINTLYKY